MGRTPSESRWSYTRSMLYQLYSPLSSTTDMSSSSRPLHGSGVSQIQGGPLLQGGRQGWTHCIRTPCNPSSSTARRKWVCQSALVPISACPLPKLRVQ